MRKIVLSVAVSLDGFIEDANGAYDWCFTDQDYGLSDFVRSIDAILMGRKSYEEAMKFEGQNPWQGIKTYVFSNTLENVPEGYEIVSGDVISAVNSLKQTEGKNIWLFGGAQLTASLMEAGLVDEVGLAVHPILLGSGKPLFSNINDRVKLELTNSKTYDTGLVFLTYTIPKTKLRGTNSKLGAR